jgi:hypothetical protein
MDALAKVTTGMTAEKAVTVIAEMMVAHYVANMPAVYGTPMMILHMEMASGSAIASHLPEQRRHGRESSSPRRNADRPFCPCDRARARD